MEDKAVRAVGVSKGVKVVKAVGEDRVDKAVRAVGEDRVDKAVRAVGANREVKADGNDVNPLNINHQNIDKYKAIKIHSICLQLTFQSISLAIHKIYCRLESSSAKWIIF